MFIDALILALGNLAIVLLALTGLWAFSVRIRDASIVDIAWGPACALSGLLTFIRVEDPGARGALLTGLSALWALRLAAYLGRRNLGHGEDPRYQAMRAKQGSDAAFARWSLPWVYWLQGVVAWFVSMPLQWGQMNGGSLDMFAAFGAIVFFAGLFFETIGDWQLARFKDDPENAGKLMTSGLWAWTRHPNYFGDALVWVGLTIIALGAPLGPFTILSPAVMIYFLVFVSGKALTEKRMSEKYPEYADYRRRTAGFIPLPPRKS